MRRGIATVVAMVFLLAAPGAAASFHLVKISEIGQGGPGQNDFVELQMYASGQNLVAGKELRTYDETGAQRSAFILPANVANGESQRTILVYRDDGPPPAGLNPDFLTPDLILTNSGAVCFGDTFALGTAIDCVSYGTFAGFPGGAPSPTGTPAPAPPPAQSINRSIAPGCATLLEASDDTDVSATDFSPGASTPRPNAVAPTERACTPDGGGGAPDTEITKAPKKKTGKAKAKFRFRSDVPGAEFECKLDKKKFKPCSSPRKYKRLAAGKHQFRVRAIADGKTDPTPAKHRWKVSP